MTTGLIAREFLDLVIRPTLSELANADHRINSPAAERLLLGTAVYESNLRYMKQRGGPARSLFQIEPTTFEDVWRWLTAQSSSLPTTVHRLCFTGKSALDQYAGNQHLACAIARLLYWRSHDPLPAADDIIGLSRYYKVHYNTSLGSGTSEKWLFAYSTECADLFSGGMI